MIVAVLHRVDVSPEVVAVWRALWFLGAICALGWIWVFIKEARPRTRGLLMCSMAIVILRAVFVNIERWDFGLYWEGLPVDTVWLIVLLVGLYRWTGEQSRKVNHTKRTGNHTP